eukprot:NODE_72_length_24857_cov_0.454399.p4 type:complete len:378 gc:universal NODE_72_length_24857_cov_0.454399:19513-18380(-)
MLVGDFSHNLFKQTKPDIQINDDTVQITANYDNIEFTGHSNANDRYFHVVDNKWTPIPFIHGKINYNLQPRQQEQQIEYYKSKKQLGTDFGTRKTKSLLNQMDKSAVQQGTLDALSQVMQSQPIPVESTTTNSFHNLLPIFDPNTLNKESIYPFSNLLPLNILNTINIKFILDLFHDPLSIKQNINHLTQFAKQRIIRASQAHNNNPEHIRWLLVIDILIKLYKQSSRTNMNIIQLKRLLNVSGEMAEYLQSQFTESTTDEYSKMKQLLTLPMKSKLLNFIMILVISLEGFQCVLLNMPSILNEDGVNMEISALLQDLHFTIPKLVERFEWIGCSVKQCSKTVANDVLKDLQCPFRDGKWPALKLIELNAPLQLKKE